MKQLILLKEGSKEIINFCDSLVFSIFMESCSSKFDVKYLQKWLSVHCFLESLA